MLDRLRRLLPQRVGKARPELWRAQIEQAQTRVRIDEIESRIVRLDVERARRKIEGVR